MHSGLVQAPQYTKALAACGWDEVSLLCGEVFSCQFTNTWLHASSVLTPGSKLALPGRGVLRVQQRAEIPHFQDE